MQRQTSSGWRKRRTGKQETVPAFSTPWEYNFTPGYNFVPHFPVLHFPALNFQRPRFARRTRLFRSDRSANSGNASSRCPGKVRAHRTKRQMNGWALVTVNRVVGCRAVSCRCGALCFAPGPRPAGVRITTEQFNQHCFVFPVAVAATTTWGCYAFKPLLPSELLITHEPSRSPTGSQLASRKN